MSSENGGAQKRNMIGMARLSCLPCRRRKSKCDREEPCSSCKLRSTERFCYTSEIEEDVAKVATPARPAEKTSSAGSPGESPSSVGKAGHRNASGASRPTKKARLESSNGEEKGKQPVATDNVTSLDKLSIGKTIETMETALKSLRETIGMQPESRTGRRSTIPAIAKWEDVSHLMPLKEECDLIIDYFFSDAQWLSSLIHSGIFRKQWSNLMKGQAIRSVFIAQACAMAAITLAFAPGYHPASRLPIQAQHAQYCTLAHEILEPPSTILFDHTGPSVDEVQARCLIISYMSFNGHIDACWQEVGRAVRQCKAMQLYDEDKWNMRELSDWDVEARRKVAYEVGMTDRWLALNLQRLSDLPSEFRLTRPSHAAFDSYDVDTGQRTHSNHKLLPNASWEYCKYIMSCGSDKVNRFLYNFLRLTPDQRYEEARQVDNFLGTILNEVPGELVYEIAFREGVNLSSPETARTACQALIVYASAYRLRCTVMRQFLLDPQSPMDLRIAALEHARKIVETTANLVTMSSNPFLAFSSAWCSGHLFCAASTFAIVYLGDTEQDLQDLSWFAGKIFEVIEALSFLSAKDNVAKRCEELLTALCTSKDWLRERFLASRSGKAVTQRRKDSSTDSGSNYTHQEDLSNARRGNVPGFNPLLLNSDTYKSAGNAGNNDTPGTNSTTANTDESSGLWSEVPLPVPASIVAPNQATTSSPEAVNILQSIPNPQQSKVDSSGEPWANWPLLNDQQWFSLLNTLEQDMSSLAGNNSFL